MADSLALSIEEQSPIFGERGSQSLPATLPPTPRNKRLLGYPDRLDVVSEPPGLIPVEVSSGAYIRAGLLNIVDAGPDGIAVNIGFDNSVGYAQWQETKLRDLFAISEVSWPTPTTREGFSCLTSDEFCAFPVVVDLEKFKGVNDAEVTLPVILNVADTWDSPAPKVHRVFGDKRYEVNVPRRYGWTPFVKVFYLLERIFAGVGVTLAREDNPFYSAGRDLWRLVVLNNCADSCCRDVIELRDLVPDCTVQEFLESLWLKFGFTYRLDFSTGTVTALFVEDLLAAGDAPADFTTMMSAPPKVTPETPQYLRLIPKTSIEGAAPPTERYAEFSRLRVVSTVVPKEEDDPDYIWADTASAEELPAEMFDYGENPDYVEYLGMSAAWKTVGGATHSNFFHWDPQPEGVEPFDVEAADESVGLLTAPYYEGGNSTGYAPLFRVGAVHYHTQGSASLVENVGVESKTPIAFMFAYQKDGARLGRPAAVDNDGEAITETDEGAAVSGQTLFYDFRGGIFESFWRRYDMLLRHGARTAEFSAYMSPLEVLNLDTLRQARVMGADALIESATYSIGAGRPVAVSLKVRPLLLRGNFDAEKEQAVAPRDLTGSRLSWAYNADNIWVTCSINATVLDGAKKEFEKTQSPPSGFAFAWDTLQVEPRAFRFKEWAADAPASPTPEQFDEDEEFTAEAVFEVRFLASVRCHKIYTSATSEGSYWFDAEVTIEMTKEITAYPRRVFA